MFKKISPKEWLILIFTGTLFLFSFQKQWVESWYSNGLYPIIGRIYRFLWGWIPFSFGDIIYTLAIGWFLWKLFSIIRLMFKKKTNRLYWLRLARKSAFFLIAAYGFFLLCWGLNYNRLGSADLLKLDPAKYTRAHLVQLTDTLQQRLEKNIGQIKAGDSLIWYNFTQLKQASVFNYRQAAIGLPFTAYQQVSVKKMLFGNLGGYFGFSGYFNPFTGEAQLVQGMPAFILPSIMSHEMAHQLGFAAEEEANLIGYLAAKNSPNPAIRYSIYHDLISYSLRELRSIDSVLYKQKFDQLNPLVKQHNQQIKDYFLGFKSPLTHLANIWYDLYLKANSQSKGLESYSFVSAWLIAYANKYGWDKL